jgi:hypothetical protein
LNALIIAAAALTPAAHAAPCAGFGDVDSASPFCPAVEWIRNRGVTLGCTASTYCPDLSVNRLSMAAFMKRLGDALTPQALTAEAVPGAIDLDAGVVVCQTADLAVTGFPRTAYADVTLTATAAAAVTLAADLVVSTDGGANWAALSPQPNRGSTAAGDWATLSDVSARDLDVGESVRFGARVTRGGSTGTAPLADSYCRIRVLVYSRTGATSPL